MSVLTAEFFQVCRETRYRSDTYETHEAFFDSQEAASEYTAEYTHQLDGVDAFLIYRCAFGAGYVRCLVDRVTRTVL